MIRAWLIVVTLVLLRVSEAQRLILLGSLPEGGQSAALAVSADGTVVVGWATLPHSILHCAFQWSATTGMQCLGTLGGAESEAHDVSADGTVIVGWAHNAQGVKRAFRWTAEHGMQDLGTLGGRWSIAYGVSADGRVVVGESETANGLEQAFRWTAEEGMRPLAGFNHYASSALGVSADGSVVVGWGVTVGYNHAFYWRAPRTTRVIVSYGSARDVSADGQIVVGVEHYIWSGSRAFRWTPEGGIRYLPLLYGSNASYAEAISADGSTIVGYLSSSRNEACRWTADGRVERLVPPPGYLIRDSIATDVSADGSVVVGVMAGGRGQRAFIWTAAEGMRDLGALGGQWSVATDVSADGKKVVGAADGGVEEHAFIWSESTGMQRLSPSLAGSSEAYAISANGSVVIGVMRISNGDSRAFRWTSTQGMQDLGTLGGASSSAYDVSADGAVIVGWAETPDQRRQAFRWTAEGGMQGLGYLVGHPHSEARAVSADGRVVVGYAGDAYRGSEAFRWTPEMGIQSLGHDGFDETFALGLSADGNVAVGGVMQAECTGYDDYEGCYEWTYYLEAGIKPPSSPWTNISSDGVSQAFAASADGSIVVGTSDYRRAMRWIAPQAGWREWEDLNQVYAHLLPPGVELQVAYAISPNGRYIVGQAYDVSRRVMMGFLLDTRRDGDVNADGCVDDADLVRVLTEFGVDGYRSLADDNGDGIVDDGDLLIVLFNFGSGC